jgi:hypothetical protein
LAVIGGSAKSCEDKLKKSLIPPFFEQESFLQGRFSKSIPPSLPQSLPRLHPVFKTCEKTYELEGGRAGNEFLLYLCIMKKTRYETRVDITTKRSP